MIKAIVDSKARVHGRLSRAW